uniref:BSD domain-containing protein n=1 Tax=Helicotheca tamesis TaxID=374047 RepID=A0A7S2IH56_9STRA|mmetsp:Transcript_9067/g.12559  ORF Transcript_9067/g.12559 Transcript_9067/m.12559 type:complete len:318 (+) Transcript_9067:120-1073(+)
MTSTPAKAQEEPTEKENLQDSMMSSSFPSLVGAMTSTDASVSEESTTEEGEVSGTWFGLNDLTSIARSIKRSIPPAIDTITDAIQRSAMTVAAEFTQLERDAEERRWREAVNNGDAIELHLPWEIPSTILDNEDQTKNNNAPAYVEDEDLKKKILKLSLEEDTFVTPFVEAGKEPDFELDDSRIHLIRRLLLIDENLNAAHDKLDDDQFETKEILFWKNYFHHCEQLRSGENEAAETDNKVDECNSRRTSIATDGYDEYVETSTTESRGVDGCEVLSVSSDGQTPPPHTLSTDDLVLVGFEGDHLDDVAANITFTEK